MTLSSQPISIGIIGNRTPLVTGSGTTFKLITRDCGGYISCDGITSKHYLSASDSDKIHISDKHVSFLLFVDMNHEENNVMFKGKATITMTT